MNKLKASAKEYRFILWAFALPLLLMAAVYAAVEVWPLGEHSVLVLDLNGQYVYYFEALRDIVREGGTLLYTWSRALGGEFMGIFAYYLASPLSLIVALFPEGYMTEALLTIILLKVGLCGATMAYYLHKTHPSDTLKVVAISTMYALSSYAVVQAHNTMWIDALIYLPLLTFAIEELIKKGRFKLYVIVLALSLMANYYIGYMICIYTAVYFFYYYLAHTDYDENNFYYESCHFIKSLIRIAVFTVIAVAIAAWVLYPAYYSLTFGKTTFTDPDYIPELKFGMLDMFTKMFIGSYDTVEPSGLPFVYCGTLTLLLLPVYFFSKKVSQRKKIFGALLLSFFLISFCVTTLDLVWHGFQAPNWLNYRYSFMYIFVALVFCYKALTEIEEAPYKNVVITGIAVSLFVMILQKLGYAHISNNAVLGTVLCCAALLLALHTVKYGYLERAGALILCIIISVEMFCAGVLNTNALDADVVISTRDSYNSFINRLTPSVEKIKAQDTGFYRMEKTVHRKTNDPFALGMNGLSNSTSTLNASQIELLRQLGYSSKSHWSKYLGGTPVSDSLLGIKYIITDVPNNILGFSYEDFDALNALYTFKNNYALPIAYGVNDEIRELDFAAYDTPFTLMNAIVTAMLGEEETVELFVEIPVTDEGMQNILSGHVSGHMKYEPNDSNSDARLTYTLTAPNTESVYMYIPTDYPRETDLTVNTYSKGTCMGNESWRIINLGQYKEGEELNVALTLKTDPIYIKNGEPHYFYYIDPSVYGDVMNRLAASCAKITQLSADHLTGTVDIAEGDTTLFTTIPYDEGWKVKVDGKETEIFKTADCLMALEISEGSHTIELKYWPDAVKYGYIFTAAGVCMFGFVCFADAKIRSKRRRNYAQSVDIKE